MQIAMVGLGKMGGNMVRRLLRGGHRIVAFDRDPGVAAQFGAEGAVAAGAIGEIAAALEPGRRVIWIMVPAGEPVDEVIAALMPTLASGDILIDGGNSNFHDTQRRGAQLAADGISFVDCGTSGGVWGLEKGYCLMIGGEQAAVDHCAPIFETLAPPDGFAHVGPSGAGHYVKMIHNGIEYGMLQAYAEGYEILHASRDYPDLELGKIAGLWQQGSVVRSWINELAERALRKDPGLEAVRGWVADSGEGRWTVQEAIDLDVPAPVITLSLQMRFRSRQDDSYGAKVIAALRNEFGGHAVKGS